MKNVTVKTKVNWDTSRIDIPIFDESLIHPRHPLREYNMHLRWITPLRFIEYQYKIIEIFTEAPNGMEMFWKGVDRSTVNNIKSKIKAGEPFYAFVIELDKHGNLLFFQEGRHRAVAMLEMSINRIPVYFAYSRYKDTTKDD